MLQCSQSTERNVKERPRVMLYWALIFLVGTLVAAVFGFGGVEAEDARLARIFFGVFLVLFLAALITGVRDLRRARRP